ncbi:hypothetical protein TrCOL_g4668 [Triparma columacea]|uniref:Uncharacterized protein n=1 Tax=Triparma columacea TaxID=722753 RepID=A0A9W7GPM9_9STRA|nr:hypothetical protein TrCOL_g4668 [Triparma columacea]
MLEGLSEAIEPAPSSINAEGHKGDEEEQMRQVKMMDKFGWGYRKKTIDASVKITSQFAAASPYIIFIVMNMIGSQSSEMEELQTYASHTPFCKYTPDELSVLNIEYQCEVFGDAHPENWERAGAIGMHNFLGISTMPVFTSPKAFLNLTESIKAVKTFGDAATTNTTVLLTHNDFVRIFAAHNFQISASDYFTYIIQGIVFVTVIFVAQIFTRVTRGSFDDVLSFNITKLEIFIVLNTFAMVLLSMYISSLNGKSLTQQLFPIVLFLLLLILTLIIAIYILCKKVVNDKSQKVLHRPRRASTVSFHPVLPSSPAPAATSHVEELQTELTNLKSTVHDQSTKMEDQNTKMEDQSTKMEEMQRMLVSLQAKVDFLTAPSP